MKAFISTIPFLFLSIFSFSQISDTSVVNFEYDTAEYNYEYDSEYDSAYASSTYTQNPDDLNPTKRELNQQYREKKFSKTEWKKIVAGTTYTEDPMEEGKQDEATGPSPVWNPAVLKLIGYIAILLLIGGIIYFLLRNALHDEASLKKSVTADTLLYDNRHIDEIGEDDLARLLREALERNDLRTAVRLYYIKLLKHLNATGFINWKKDKTNHDYADELAAFKFTREFRRLMTAYEIIWYGERTPTPEEFRKLQSNFSDLHRQAERLA